MTLDLPLFKKIMLGLTLLVLLWIPFDAVRLLKVEPGRNVSFPEKSMDLEPRPLKPLAVYLEEFKRNALFGSSENSGTAQVSGISIQERVKNYRLQGIVVMEEPEAIFSDEVSQKSFFVKQGEILGELRLKEIRRESVVLEYGNEEIELSMEEGARD